MWWHHGLMHRQQLVPSASTLDTLEYWGILCVFPPLAPPYPHTFYRYGITDSRFEVPLSLLRYLHVRTTSSTFCLLHSHFGIPRVSQFHVSTSVFVSYLCRCSRRPRARDKAHGIGGADMLMSLFMDSTCCSLILDVLLVCLPVVRWNVFVFL